MTKPRPRRLAASRKRVSKLLCWRGVMAAMPSRLGIRMPVMTTDITVALAGRGDELAGAHHCGHHPDLADLALVGVEGDALLRGPARTAPAPRRRS